MAGSSMTFSYESVYDGAGRVSRFSRVIADWVSDDATGAVTGTSRKICGRLVKVVTDPGSPAPSANYDIVLNDDNAANILGNCDADLQNRHTSNTETIDCFVKNAAATALAVHPAVASTVQIAITNAGNSKAGQIVLYLEA